jgi:hypothetical protein
MPYEAVGARCASEYCGLPWDASPHLPSLEDVINMLAGMIREWRICFIITKGTAQKSLIERMLVGMDEHVSVFDATEQLGCTFDSLGDSVPFVCCGEHAGMDRRVAKYCSLHRMKQLVTALESVL